MKRTTWGAVLALAATLVGAAGCGEQVPQPRDPTALDAVATGQTSQPLAGYSLLTDVADVYPGGSITVFWEAPADHSGSDWIGLFAVSAPNTSYRAYQYVPPGSSGSMSFTAPSDVGTFEFRYLPNNGYTSVTSSNTFSVVIPYICRDLHSGDNWFPTWVHCCDSADQTQSFWIRYDGFSGWYSNACYYWGVRTPY